MRSLFSRLGVASALILAVSSPAFAGQIWTDVNGDGLPGDKVFGQPSDNVTVDVWIDSQSFVFSEFQAVIDIGTANFVAAAPLPLPCTGGTVSSPPVVIAQGTGCPGLHGVLKVARFTIHINDCVTCPTPLIKDGESPSKSLTCTGQVSRLIGSGNIFCFSTFGFDCVECDAPSANENKTWGRVKGLYR